MNAESIFAPVVVLVSLTFGVLVYTGYKRIGAIAAGRLKAADFRYGENTNVPPDVALANRNFMNLLETPILFYVACLVTYVTHHATPAAVYMAWAYVGLRVLHTTIHLAYNRTLYRFGAFLTSNVVLAAFWLWLALTLFG